MASLMVVAVWAASPASATSCTGKTFSWTGKGDNFSWSDQNNWDPNNQGPPSTDDIATIDASSSEFFVNAPQSVCDLNLTGAAQANGYVFFHAGAGITVSDNLTMTGSGVYWDGSIHVEGTTDIEGSVTYGSGPGSFPLSPTHLETQTLTIGGSSDVKLSDGTSDIVVDGSADIGSSTIWSNGSSAADNIAQMQFKGTVSLSGDVDAQVDWQLLPAAQMDLAGHTLNIHSHSYSRWSNGAMIMNSSPGSGGVQFHDGTWLIVDGSVDLGPGVLVELTDSTRLADGADYVGQAQPVGTSGEFTGSGTIDWVSGEMLGAIQLDSTITMVMDGGGNRYVGDGSANTAISQLNNLGHLILVDGLLDVSGNVGVLNNAGEFEIKTGALLRGQPGYDDVVNEQTGVVEVTVPLSNPQPVPAVIGASLLNYGVLHVPAGLTLQFNGGQQSLFGDGGALTGGGTVSITDRTKVLARGTTTIEDGTTLDFNGYGSYLVAGSQLPDNSWVPAVFTTLFGGTGTFKWEQGAVDGHLTTAGGLAVSVTDPGNGATRRIGGLGSPYDPSLMTFGSPTTIDNAMVSIDDGSTAQITGTLTMTGAAPALGNGGGSGSLGIVIEPTGSLFVSDANTVATLDYPVHNQGVVSVGSGTELNLINESYRQNAAQAQTLMTSGAKVTAANPMLISAGSLHGPGAITGSVEVSGGGVWPGVDLSHPGTLSVSGDYTQTGGTLSVLVGGTASGQYDQLSVGGTAQLGGIVEPLLESGYHPTYLTAFPAVTASTRNGSFSTIISSGLPAGTAWKQDLTNPAADTLFLNDTSAPIAKLTSPTAPFTTTNSAALSWSATDSGGSGIASYDVEWSSAGLASTLSSTWNRPSAWQNLTTTRKTFSGMVPGHGYCFKVRARDHAGNVGAWSTMRCIADVLDDRALSAKGSWIRRTGSGYIDGTYSQSTTRGSVLSLTKVTTRQVAVWARRCSTCGSIAVYVGSRKVGSVSLHYSTTQTSHEFLFTSFPLTTGSLRIVVTSSSGVVLIDAVGARHY